MVGFNRLITFRDCVFTNHHGFGILDYGYAGNSTSDVLVDHCRFLYCGVTNAVALGFQDGSALNVGGSRWTVNNNFIAYCGRGIELFVSDNIIQTDITVSGNTIVSNYQRGIFNDTQSESRNVRLINNYIEGDANWRTFAEWAAIYAGGPSTNLLIRGNIISNFSSSIGTGLLIKGGSVVDIDANLIFNTGTGIRIGSGSGTLNRARIRGNFIRRTEGQGIYITGLNHSEISDNTIMDVGLTGSSSGIYLSDDSATTTNVIVRGNRIEETTGTGANGVFVNTGADNCHVYQNHVSGFSVGVGDLGNGTRINEWAVNTNGGFTQCILGGIGSPEGVKVADIGSLYLRADVAPAASFYIKTNGNGLATGWSAR